MSLFKLMFVKKLEKLPEDMKKILKACSLIAAGQGYSVFLIGGIVRDIILNRDNYDLDLVIEGDGIAFARLLAEKFKADMKKHHAFGTASVYCRRFKVDIATARKESYEHWGALPGVRPALLGQDLFRRDFSINAMAVSLNKKDYGVLLDFYGGYRDLKQKKIRVLHDNSFFDDPTRIFRAIRFEQRFSFFLDRHSSVLLKKAVRARALDLVHEHRIRDELVLILNEPKAYFSLRRINELMGFSFLHHSCSIKRDDFFLLLRISRALQKYQSKFPGQSGLKPWVVYLMGLTAKLPARARREFVCRYGFRKRERDLLLSFGTEKERVRSLGRAFVSRSEIYETLKPLSAEELVFYYAFFKDRRVRSAIILFWEKLSHYSLRVKGKDLKRMGIKPVQIYTRLLQELLQHKIEKNFSGKEAELKELRSILEKMGCGNS